MRFAAVSIVAVAAAFVIPMAVILGWHQTLPDYGGPVLNNPPPEHYHTYASISYVLPGISPAQTLTHDRAWRLLAPDVIEGTHATYQLALVDAPYAGGKGYYEALAFAEQHCPQGSPLRVNVDDRQPRDRAGRTVAAVWCTDLAAGHGDHMLNFTMRPTLNELLLREGHACLLAEHRPHSEMGGTPWALEPAGRLCD